MKETEMLNCLFLILTLLSEFHYHIIFMLLPHGEHFKQINSLNTKIFTLLIYMRSTINIYMIKQCNSLKMFNKFFSLIIWLYDLIIEFINFHCCFTIVSIYLRILEKLCLKILFAYPNEICLSATGARSRLVCMKIIFTF